MTPARFHNRYNHSTWLPDFFGDFFDEDSWAPAIQGTNCTAPSINVIENEDNYILEFAAPGMTKDDFTVKLDDEGDLVVNMEKKEDKKEDKEAKKENRRYLRREFSYTKFQQTLLLPEDARREDITAKVENGILTVQIPKVVKVEKENRNRAIEIC